jgi:signal transduction histidine kinase
MMRLLQQKLAAVQKEQQAQDGVSEGGSMRQLSDDKEATVQPVASAKPGPRDSQKIIPSAIITTHPDLSPYVDNNARNQYIVTNQNALDASPRPIPMSETKKEQRKHVGVGVGSSSSKPFDKIPVCLMSQNRTQFFVRLTAAFLVVSIGSGIIGYIFGGPINSVGSDYLNICFAGMFLLMGAQQCCQIYSTNPGTALSTSSTTLLASVTASSSTDKLGIQNAAGIALFVAVISLWNALQNFAVLHASSSLSSTDGLSVEVCSASRELLSLHLMYLSESASFLPFLAIIVASLGNVQYCTYDNLMLISGMSVSVLGTYVTLLVATPRTVKVLFFVGQLILAVIIHRKIHGLADKESMATKTKDTTSFASHNQTSYYHYLLLFSSRKRIIITWLSVSWLSFNVLNLLLVLVSAVLSADGEAHGSGVQSALLGSLSTLYSVHMVNILYVIIFGINFMSRLVGIHICATYGYELGHTSIYELEAQNAAHVDRRAFLRYVFHEVRVPLNSISLGLELLTESEGITQEDDKETVIMMKEAITFMGETLNDVLAIQKVEEGALTLIFKPFDLNDLITISIQPYLEISQSKRLNIVSTIGHDVCRTVVGDKYRLKHVLMNIISNAVKYSHVGAEIHIIISDEGPVNSLTAECLLPSQQAAAVTSSGIMSRFNTSSSSTSPRSNPGSSYSNGYSQSVSTDFSSPASSSKSINANAKPPTSTIPLPCQASQQRLVPGVGKMGEKIPSPASSGKDVSQKFAFTPHDTSLPLPLVVPVDIAENATGDNNNSNEVLMGTVAADRYGTPKASTPSAATIPKVPTNVPWTPDSQYAELNEGSAATTTSRPTTPSATTKEYRYFTIAVVDTGCGIDESNIESLFNPFLSTKPGELKKGRGSGIGLAICKEIMKLHGGNISCTSVKGIGSTFMIYVPLEIVNVKSAHYSVKNALKPSINEVSMCRRYCRRYSEVFTFVLVGDMC